MECSTSGPPRYSLKRLKGTFCDFFLIRRLQTTSDLTRYAKKLEMTTDRAKANKTFWTSLCAVRTTKLGLLL